MFLRKLLDSRHSLLFRLTLLHAVAFTILASLSFLVLYNRLFSLTMDRMDEELLDEAEHYAAIMAQEGLEGVRAAMIRGVESEDPDEELQRVLNLKGDVLATTDMSSWGPVDKDAALMRLRGEGVDYIAETITVPGREYNARVISTLIGPDTVIQLGETLEEAEEYLGIFRTLFFILIGVLILASSVIGWFLARRAVVDMETVTETAEYISKGSYDRRVKTKGQLREIEKLGAAFNRMLDRIQFLLKAMREINDNIAHDLRSPLARIRGVAEMTLLKDKSVEDYKDMAASTIEECDTLIDMINTMLDITEAEAGVSEVRKEEVEVVDLILEACELFRPIAEAKEVSLQTRLPQTLRFEIDKKKLQRIVSNIIENAIKYTPEHGTVTVTAAAQDGEIQIDVEDTGMGISGADLPHIFERFYRCDRSRSDGGVGLGLSLAKAYTESLSGAIHVKSAPNLGSTFSVTFAK
jgi:signal transduction histidine kinase